MALESVESGCVSKISAQSQEVQNTFYEKFHLSAVSRRVMASHPREIVTPCK